MSGFLDWARDEDLTADEREERAARHVENAGVLGPFVGRTVARAELGSSGGAHHEHPDTVRLTFTDGSVLEVTGNGYDEWGVWVDDGADPEFVPILEEGPS
jgi:hypothetical protein